MGRTKLLRRGNSGGFTLMELLGAAAIVVAVVVVVVVATSGDDDDDTARDEPKGSFTLAPATIPSSGADFTYTVLIERSGQWQPHPGREYTFRVAPAQSVFVTPERARSRPGGDINLRVTVTEGYCEGGNIWATDVISGDEDPPVSFTVECE